MKKLLIISLAIFMLLFTCSCSNKKNTEKKINDDSNKVNNKEENTDEVEKETYIDDNPIILGLYIDNNGVTSLVDDFYSTWKEYTDIIVFSTFYTQDKTLAANTVANTFDKYKNNYTNIDNYRIGYNIKFSLKNGSEIDKTILNTADSLFSTDYLQFYLYDDLLHRNDSWYSHITESEWNNSTMMTSLKITGSWAYNQIVSPIEITVFTYDSTDDFDSNGHYRGKSSYAANLYNQ